MRCPFCGSENTSVKDSRSAEDNTAVRRRRVCESCGARFTTFERVQLREITVVKRDGKRVPFDRDRLTRSITIALRKRPVDRDQIDQMVSGIARNLESAGETEVSSNDVGEFAMEALRRVDPVGYVRFASVYKDFKDPNDFAQFIENTALDDEGDEE
ncbi:MULTISPECIES: transcriptional regulator NrdR [Hyphomonas]|uniref:Transcriptional repressor NrdR n=1 Tax=Hyphomonas atlantica TaxID=1280948 RepID=A0A353YP27_9PROT|nr:MULTISPECIES: transcriptional regulator NrdR [Hyphomonas]OUX86766.1 MAG: transcriptional regulator NrdR [Hyphomonas sp. TMED31]MAH92985.1 transcriptional repressor NrdR [Hyphomonas sp.]HAE95060.1 transcriptional repressor NrdR [Hyphomonas atlantica]HBH44764.1 transcriptional repressor NrdR [Hyphomonas atlantica]HBQ48223.1 transcriptional repressor NrdR [Hyphomonas atlantica]